MDNPVGALQERAQAEGLPAPQYVLEDAQGQSHCPTFTIKVTWQLRSAIGVASNKKEAKRKAAMNLLEQLNPNKTLNTSEQNADKQQSKETSSEPTSSTQSQECSVDEERGKTKYSGNQVGALQEYMNNRGLGAPVYTDKAMEGPAHKRWFTINCKVGDIEMDGMGSTKKEAKQQAAGAVLEAILSSIKHSNTRDSATDVQDTIQSQGLNQTKSNEKKAEVNEKSVTNVNQNLRELTLI